jgi:hypothetical protein
VDAAADDGSAFADGFERLGHKFSGGSEDDRGIQLHRGHFVRAADPNGAETHGELFCRFVAGAGKGINLALLILGNLRDDMRRGAETVNTEPLAVAGFDQAAIAD